MWRKEGPNTMAWVATAGNCICIVLHSTSWVQSYLYCIVLYRSTWAQSPDLSEMKSVSGTNGGGALPPLGTFSALNELGLLFKCVCFACVFLSDPSPIIGNACQWLTHWLTHWLLFSKLYWCDPGVWRCQLQTCWCCNCCWWWSCWQQFVADLEAEVWSKS